MSQLVLTTWDACHNVTTNERLNARRYSYMRTSLPVRAEMRRAMPSPFDLGVYRNVLQLVGAPGHAVDWTAVFSVEDYRRLHRVG